jgi:dienelactone hydrolase
MGTWFRPIIIRLAGCGVLALLLTLGPACSDSSGGSPTAGTGGGAGTGGVSATGGGGGNGGSSAGGGASGSGTGGSSAAGMAGASAGTGGSAAGTAGSSGGSVAGTGGATGGSSGGGGRGGSAGGTGVGGSAGRGGASGGAGSGGRGGSGGQAGGQGGATGGAGGSPLPPVTDYSAPGPFTTTTNPNVGPGQGYTVYRPQTLGQNGFLHAPIIFGPGIGMQASQLSGLLLSFASHGFVVVGTPVLNGGPGAAANLKAMTDGLDWIIAQNTMAGTYQGKLDVTHAVAMGYSVGGTSAVQLGGHAAVATTVSIHGHTATSNLHGPLLQTTGTGDTVGLPLQMATYQMSQVQTFLGTVMGADHGYIQQNNGGVERPAIIAWMRYWIYNDAGAQRYFYGNDCVMCTSPWVNPQRKNWQ